MLNFIKTWFRGMAILASIILAGWGMSIVFEFMFTISMWYLFALAFLSLSLAMGFYFRKPGSHV